MTRPADPRHPPGSERARVLRLERLADQFADQVAKLEERLARLEEELRLVEAKVDTHARHHR